MNGISLITNKKVIIHNKKVNATELFLFNDYNYPLERDIDFNKNGKITKIGKSAAEGLVYYYRNPAKRQLNLNLIEKYLSFEIKIDTINHLIIENRDTIKSFKVNRSKKIIYSENKKTNRMNIYSFE